MASTQPGSAPDLQPNAHYHAIKATATWAAFVAAVKETANRTPAARAREDAQRKRETTYERGILGRS
jgi:hypothetical protein